MPDAMLHCLEERRRPESWIAVALSSAVNAEDSEGEETSSFNADEF
jgi:hypothetical protein